MREKLIGETQRGEAKNKYVQKEKENTRVEKNPEKLS